MKEKSSESKGFFHPLKPFIQHSSNTDAVPILISKQAYFHLFSSMYLTPICVQQYWSDGCMGVRVDEWPNECIWNILSIKNYRIVFHWISALVAPPKFQNTRHYRLGTCLGKSARFFISNLPLHRKLPLYISGWFKECNRTEGYCLPR